MLLIANSLLPSNFQEEEGDEDFINTLPFVDRVVNLEGACLLFVWWLVGFCFLGQEFWIISSHKKICLYINASKFKAPNFDILKNM